MSLFMAEHSEAGVMVITDTLATTVEGDSFLFVTKCAIVPHLNMVIAGTGNAQLPSRWVGTVMEAALCRDIDLLNEHAPGAIRSIWDDVERGPGADRATVYHYGLSEERNCYVGYAYRSSDDFESEELEPGFRVKPQTTEPLASAPESIEEMVALACRVRDEQDALPASERIYIGGDLVMVALQNGVMSAARIHRWDDFEPMWLDMNARFQLP